MGNRNGFQVVIIEMKRNNIDIAVTAYFIENERTCGQEGVYSGEITQLVMSLPCKLKGLSSVLITNIKGQAWWCLLVIPSRRWRPVDPWGSLADQPSDE